MSTGRSDALAHGLLPWPLEIRAHPRARHVRLRIDEARGRFVLTHPRRMARRTALDWVAGQRDWAAAQIVNMAPAIPLAPGSTIPVEGVDRLIDWQPFASRRPQLDASNIVCGGPLESLAGRIERYLRDLARDRLSERTAEVASRAGVRVTSVSVADTTSRWGSCSDAGAIRYNWRLILAPPKILDWVVAHEVAHRRHMNHGTEFHALEAALYDGDVGAARSLLKLLGPGLKRVGRTI